MASDRRAAWRALGDVRLGGADATGRSGATACATVDTCTRLPAAIVATATLPPELRARSPHLNAFAKISALCAARRAHALV